MDNPLVQSISNDDVQHRLLTIKERIEDLAQSLEHDVPQYKQILREIHSNLREDQAVVTLLTEEEIAVVVQGLCKAKNVQLQVTEVKSAKSAERKQLKSITANDL